MAECESTKEQFKKKDVHEVSAYLKENGIEDNVCEKFEGILCSDCRSLVFIIHIFERFKFHVALLHAWRM